MGNSSVCANSLFFFRIPCSEGIRPCVGEARGRSGLGSGLFNRSASSGCKGAANAASAKFDMLPMFDLAREGRRGADMDGAQPRAHIPRKNRLTQEG
jgi:hypothetical protein